MWRIDAKKMKILQEILEDENYFKKPGALREYSYIMGEMTFEKEAHNIDDLEMGQSTSRNYNIAMLVGAEAVRDYGYHGSPSWCKFKDIKEIDVDRNLKGIICTVRDRVFEEKVIEKVLELTALNPESRVPVFDFDGNQIWPTRKKREEIEGAIRQKQEAAMEELE